MSAVDDRDREIEQALADALGRRLPQHPASHALKRRLAAQWAAVRPADADVGTASVSVWRRRAVIPALAAALVLAVVVSLYYGSGARDRAGTLVAEAVNDHLRVVSVDRRLPVESGGIHQVKPWFTGRLDFAPAVAFGGDAEFPLKGGAIEHFLDRKAAVFVFTRRLHAVSLLVVRADGLRWPSGGLPAVAGHPARVATARGFNVVRWRQGDLGYLLVSDVERRELLDLAARVAGTVPPPGNN
ncbi:MAG: hypothetical protein HY216_16915 [Candidatus Rokubacteria bacterium]|nr:hypothetical protein [Candidatus Rokubacteria bacterium]